MRKRRFSKENGKTSENEMKIELLNCKFDGRNCKNYLLDINKSFNESETHYHNKDYQLSIQSLKAAFNKTFELQESTCTQCASLFRNTIIKSVENIHDDLQKMSNSLFRGKKFQGSYLLVDNTLQDLKKKHWNLRRI